MRRLLIVLSPLLAGAGDPPPPCAPSAAMQGPSSTVSPSFEMSGVAIPGASGSVFGTAVTDPLAGGCTAPVPAPDNGTTLRNEKAEALHGLDTPRLLRSPVHDQRPEYR